jgi:hypothetical protein
MNAQEIFNKAYLGLIEQGEPAIGPNGSCCYINDSGRMCGVGMLLEPQISRLFESNCDGDSCIGTCSRAFAGQIPEWIEPNLHLLEQIQGAHDKESHAGPTVWLRTFKTRMACIAERHNLTVPEAA